MPAFSYLRFSAWATSAAVAGAVTSDGLVPSGAGLALACSAPIPVGAPDEFPARAAPCPAWYAGVAACPMPGAIGHTGRARGVGSSSARGQEPAWPGIGGPSGGVTGETGGTGSGATGGLPVTIVAAWSGLLTGVPHWPQKPSPAPIALPQPSHTCATDEPSPIFHSAVAAWLTVTLPCLSVRGKSHFRYDKSRPPGQSPLVRTE